MTAPRATRRSLILAGGGMKVAFQAGVLQVWLDEAGIEFTHADGCSGGTFNLAMLCQGYTGTQIADAWRATHPREGVSVRLADVARFPFGRSLITLDRYRRYVFRRWGLDAEQVRAATIDATFNAYDITRHRLRVFSVGEFSIDVLCACVSLPVWFPPVQLDDGLYTDAVFATDANIDAALERGADEIWIVWTVSTRPDWLPGPLAQFFHALESAANGHLRQALDRIDANNDVIDSGGQGPLGRHVEIRLLEAEVPMHYLLVLGNDRLHRAVEQGVAAGRAWCDRQGVARTPPPTRPRAPTPYDDLVELRFRDGMRGTLVRPDDTTDPVSVDAHLVLVVDDAGRFATDAAHSARLEGHVVSRLFSGRRADVVGGSAQILVDDGEDLTRKQMRYRALLVDAKGARSTLVGVKRVESGQVGRLWEETTTLYTRLLDGHVENDETTHLLAVGTLRMRPGDVARQLLTVRIDGPRLGAKAGGLVRFAAAFVGNLWDVYARRLSSYAPF